MSDLEVKFPIARFNTFKSICNEHFSYKRPISRSFITKMFITNLIVFGLAGGGYLDRLGNFPRFGHLFYFADSPYLL